MIKRWLAEWCTPSYLDVITSKGVERSVEKKRKDATKKVAQNFLVQWKKKVADKPQLEECATKEQAEREHVENSNKK